jgi:hypothetical protein
MMADDSLKMTFPGASLAEGNQLAGSLQECLRDVDPALVVERERTSGDTMDFGASLGVILAPAVISAVAKGVAAWLSRNSGVRLEIRQDDGTVIVLSHVDSHDVPRIVRALSRGS